jgi:hypothetical protein
VTAVRASRWIGWRPISLPLRELLEQREDMLVQHLALGAHASLDVSQAARRQAVWLARVGRLLGRRVCGSGLNLGTHLRQATQEVVGRSDRRWPIATQISDDGSKRVSHFTQLDKVRAPRLQRSF